VGWNEITDGETRALFASNLAVKIAPIQNHSSQPSPHHIQRALDEREQLKILILHQRPQWQRRLQRHSGLRYLRL
jgi:hypothetical protein